jgi:T-complex protein 1 subunit theta
MRRGVPNIFKSGTTHLSGIDEAVIRNLQACKGLSDLTRTSLGPQVFKLCFEQCSASFARSPLCATGPPHDIFVGSLIQGMNKMIINHLGKIFVTSDTATIMRELEVDHAAARLLSMAAAMQEQEMGDGSNFVVCFGGMLAPILSTRSFIARK